MKKSSFSINNGFWFIEALIPSGIENAREINYFSSGLDVSEEEFLQMIREAKKTGALIAITDDKRLYRP